MNEAEAILAELRAIREILEKLAPALVQIASPVYVTPPKYGLTVESPRDGSFLYDFAGKTVEIPIKGKVT